jgi:protein SCO1/2
VNRRVLCLLVAFVTSACQKTQPPARHYQMRGVVVRIDPANKMAAIDGEKIDGWMDAMTMEYPIPDPVDLKRLKPGDKISATVDVRELDYSLSHIQILK